jgi:hypothetical protein
MSIKKLRKRYKELFKTAFGIQTNKAYLIRKIAYKLQELEYGSISNTAQDKLNEYIKNYDPINKMAQENGSPVTSNIQGRDRRVPMPGTIITKNYKGKTYNVKVLEKGFEYEGTRYKSLSAIAKKITGSHWNGYTFFNME